jgi:hypothetical protein
VPLKYQDSKLTVLDFIGSHKTLIVSFVITSISVKAYNIDIPKLVDLGMVPE